jgi:AraC family transcriptional regulator of adaptative response/methylated-DNA-[protein]-cysteine methyltransferase
MADRLWQAVAHRDRRADGLFVYAVRSTGIYCRPSCPSRRPRRERVDFFPSPSAALARGYRACLRCRPDSPVTGSPASERVRRACRAIHAEPSARWTAARIARVAGSSVVQTQRAFRVLLGMTPRDYVAACRRQAFTRAIREGSSVTDATFAAGFGSSSRMYAAIRLPGFTPATYGKGGQGASIAWATTDSAVGRILVAATSRGLCFVEVGDTVAGLVEALRAEFPRASIGSRPSSELTTFTDAARGVATADRVPAEVPVDIRGTAFQWKVWSALTRIPRGDTRTYTEVAATIGARSSVRAVARACATNPIALLVPCHRVVGADGSLRGYRWGLGVKRALIDAEQARRAK